MEKEQKNNPDKGIEDLPLKIKFNRKKAVFLLDVDSNSIKPDIKKDEAKKRGLFKKEDFHLTVIGTNTAKKIRESIKNLSLEEKEKKMKEIHALIKLMKWKANMKNDFFYIQKDYKEPESDEIEKRETIIQMADLDKLEEFYKKLDALVGQKFEIPIPHVTLYSNSSVEENKLRGIGVYSKKQFHDLKPERI